MSRYAALCCTTLPRKSSETSSHARRVRASKQKRCDAPPLLRLMSGVRGCCADFSPSSLRFDMVMSLMSLRLLMARGLGCTHAQARYSLVTPGNDVLVISGFGI